MCGLNPHAGEGGLLGDEEECIINPLLAGLRPRYPGLTACEPADTLFARQLRGEFDVVIALYHDQGLAPLKAVDFDEAVNVTLGLPFVAHEPGPRHRVRHRRPGHGQPAQLHQRRRGGAASARMARRPVRTPPAGGWPGGLFREIGVVIPRLCPKNHATIPTLFTY